MKVFLHSVIFIILSGCNNYHFEPIDSNEFEIFVSSLEDEFESKDLPEIYFFDFLKNERPPMYKSITSGFSGIVNNSVWQEFMLKEKSIVVKVKYSKKKGEYENIRVEIAELK